MSVLKAVASLLVLVFFLGAAGAIGGYIWLQNEIARPGPSLMDEVFVVRSGEGLGSIAARLETAGLIRDDRLLRIAFRLSDAEGAAKAGEYSFPAGLSVADVRKTLIDGAAILHRITIPEGLTTAQIARLIEADEILEGDLPATLPAEGSLLPDTYLFGRGMSRADRKSVV